MTLGTLRDQVIYPDTKQDQQRKHINDDVLKEHLEQVNDISVVTCNCTVAHGM